MAIIQTDKADIYGGIETSLEAEKLLQKKNRLYNELKSSNYNNLAIANANLENFQHAEKYYLLAIQNTKDTPSKDIYYNNLACNYESMGQYKKAEEFYSLALKTKDSISYARALNNYARCLFLENKGNQNLIKSYLNKALSIREKKNNNWDLNSSYATLSEYYKKSNPEKAIFYAEKMYEIAHKINNPDNKLDALEKLILITEPVKAKSYFNEYQHLNDSLQRERNRAKNQFAFIRFKTDKKQMENETLKVKEAQSEVKLLRVQVLVGILFIGFIFMVYWYQKRKTFQE